MSSPLSRRLLAEAAGTALLVGIGTGAMVLTSGQSELRTWLLPIAWFAAVTIPILLFASISGAHLNPVVTLALAVRRQLPASGAAANVVAQLAGALAASATVKLVLGNGDRLGATTPSGNLAWDFLGEVAFTFLLVLVVLLLVDEGAGRGRWRLVLPGAVVAASTYVIGPWTRSSLNPARTLGPAVLTGLFTDLWLYLLSAPVGALLAVLTWRMAHAPAKARRPQLAADDLR
ncbi:MAG: aquaporin [Thermoplasmata archaeon]|nr:aquaporin [Thermoplasmata archaeon]